MEAKHGGNIDFEEEISRDEKEVIIERSEGYRAPCAKGL